MRKHEQSEVRTRYGVSEGAGEAETRNDGMTMTAQTQHSILPKSPEKRYHVVRALSMVRPDSIYSDGGVYTKQKHAFAPSVPVLNGPSYTRRKCICAG